MKRIYKNEQTGRSMVEMLGVLAIIAVLSVAGIAGYSKAMAKFKQGKCMDQISMLAANIRTLYSGQRTYAGLTNATAISAGIVGTDMATGADTITNPYAGAVTITSVANNVGGANVADGAFSVAYAGLSRDACVALATADWGSGSTSGLVSLAAGATVVQPQDLPMTLANATTGCSCGTANSCSVTWVFY